ncbi:MAG: proline racemase family protein [Mogibacterium sp.]|nr:proline racemase family protein [Mogibacterium sp.]
MDLKPTIRMERYPETIRVIDSHAAGMGARVVIGGVPELQGSTMREKMNWFRDHYDYIRTAVVCEPRGHNALVGTVLTEPCDPEADYGIFYIEPPGYLDMCGHGTIATSTVLVETGLVEVREPETLITFETPAGLVRATVRVEGGRATGVSIVNVPAYVFRQGLTTEFRGKTLCYDVVFGGNSFAMIPIEQMGMEIGPETVDELLAIQLELMPQISREVAANYPELGLEIVEGCEFYGKSPTPGCDARNVVLCGKLADRSPCGTGTSAKLALLHAEGKLGVGEKYVNESFIGSTFVGEILGETQVGPYRAVIPQITGRAFITGTATFLPDPEDPFRNGFTIG